MRNALFFVTAVTLMGSFAACSKKHNVYRQEVQVGNEKLDQATAVENELRTLNVNLDGASAKKLDKNWFMQFSLDERRKVKEDLSHYLSLVNDIMALDARRGLVVTHKDQIISKRDNATAFEKLLEDFESVYGENYKPSHLPTAAEMRSYSI
jgi:hypothetical protein